MKKLAVFDLDGTLFDTGEVNFLAYQRALREVGYEVDKEYYIRCCNGYHYKRFLPNILKDVQEEKIADIMEMVHQRKKAYYKECLYAVRVNEFLFDMIERFKSMYHIACVTTASRQNTEEVLEFTGKRQLFDLVLCQEDVIKKKPDPEGFLKAIEYFQVTPKNTIVFEDSDVGVEAAVASGACVMKICKF